MKNSRFYHIHKRLQQLKEKQLQFLILNYFRRNGFLTDYTHGSTEHGSDVILTLKPNEDPLGIGQYIFIQAKCSRVNLSYWRNTIQGQMLALYNRPPMLLNSEKTLSRRLVFITSREINPEVITEIIHWNEQMHIPIEAFDGQRLAKLLADKGYRLMEMEEDIQRPININSIEETTEVIDPKILGHKTIAINAKPIESVEEVTWGKSLERRSKKNRKLD